MGSATIPSERRVSIARFHNGHSIVSGTPERSTFVGFGKSSVSFELKSFPRLMHSPNAANRSSEEYQLLSYAFIFPYMSTRMSMIFILIIS